MPAHITITINGQQVGLWYGLYAIQHFTTNSVDLPNDDKNKLVQLLSVGILYAGYLNDCEASKAEAKLTYRDFYGYVEQCLLNNDITDINRAWEAYNESTKPLKADLIEQPEEGKKKKSPLIGKKLKSSA